MSAAMIPPAPKKSAFDFAKSNVGLHEARNEAALRQYLYDGGKNLSPVTRAWCADFVNASIAKAGGKGTGSGMARSFLNWGQKVDKPQQGDVAVFGRNGPNSGQGHVAFFYGYNKGGGVRVLGGNQGDMVSYATYPSSRVLGFRRGEAQQSAAFTPPETINRDGIISTIPGNPQTVNSNMPVLGQQPAGLAPPTVQQAAYSPTPAPKSNQGTNPTPGREVLAMNGLGPEERRDALQGAFDRGNKDMVYVHDNNERVVARPGEPRWSPSGTDNPANAGPNFANTFMVENGYGTNPRPMPDSNPLKGSRYDDGTYTGQFPTAGVSAPITQRGPGMTPPGTQTPAPIQSTQPQIMASTPPPTVPSYEAPQVPMQTASFQTPVQLQPAGMAPPTLAANTAAPPMIKPSPYTQELATASQPMQTAALQPPQSINAAKPNAPGNVATTNTNVSQQLAALPAGSKGATEVAAGLPTPQVKENLGGTPQISPIATTETNAPNNTGTGRTAQAAAPESAPKPAGIAPPTKTAAAETPTPNQVDVKAQPNTNQPQPSQVQSDKPSSRMALGGPGMNKPETEPVKPLQGLMSELFGIDPAKKTGGAGMNGPGGNSFPQWNLNPANPGVTFSGGGFFGFGGG